jgi:hypothetical protein
MEDEEFGTDKLEEVLKKYSNTELMKIHEAIINHLDKFRGSMKYMDDITIFSCRVDLTEKN